MSGFFVRTARIVRRLLVLLLLLSPCQAGAHSDAGPMDKAAGETVGVTEHLGAKIPLDLTFRDEAGKPVKLAGLITGPTVILPVFYRCTNVCSVLQTRMAAALQKLELSPVAEYRVISVSFDERETPEMAARSRQTYLSAIRKPFPDEGWRFLTGDSVAIRRLFNSVGFTFQRQGADFIHPVVSIMVAGDGTIVRYLYGVTVLPKDLALAITEARSGVAGASIRKVMDFCFSYDPVGKTYVFNLLRISATTVILAAGAFLAFLLLTGRKRRRHTVEKP
jgi:protein SCO1/2